MESDDRFKHLASDPRFKTLRKKQRKVEIDDRFKSMFTDEKFTLKYSKDKRGRNQKKTTGDDLKKYYHLKDNHQPESKAKAKKNKKKIAEDEDQESESSVDENEDKESVGGKGESDSAQEESDVEAKEEDETESELSSSSDESESENEGDVVSDDGVDPSGIVYDWEPLDHDAERAETTTKRLALQNLDWDRLDVKDIFTLVNSVRAPISVRIYVSDYGKQRLQQEAVEGPKEIVDMTEIDEDEEEYNQLHDKMMALKNMDSKSLKVNEYEDADEVLDSKNEELMERIRRYQLSKMKYYYAVAEFDSIESAEAVYKELDGMEYEGSSLELDLRFIPDDVEFDTDDIKAECDKLPDLTSYKAPQFINSALQQKTVKFTWDETDVKRQEKLQRAYTKEELEKDDLEAYLASETDTEEELDEDDQEQEGIDSISVVTANSEARVNKYKMLLKSLDEEADKKKKVDVDVEWGNYSEAEEEFAKANDDEDEVWPESDGSSDSMLNEASLTKEKEKKLTKKERKKAKKGKKSDKNDQEGDDELDLLVMDVESKQRGEFQFNPLDDRFKAVYESGLYNIDPSHPNFKRTQAFDIIAEKKREKRQKTSV